MTKHLQIEEKVKEFENNPNWITTSEQINWLRAAFTDLLSTHKAELVEVLKGMKIKNPICYCKTHPEHNCGVTSNDAIDDMLTHLTT